MQAAKALRSSTLSPPPVPHQPQAATASLSATTAGDNWTPASRPLKPSPALPRPCARKAFFSTRTAGRKDLARARRDLKGVGPCVSVPGHDVGSLLLCVCVMFDVCEEASLLGEERTMSVHGDAPREGLKALGFGWGLGLGRGWRSGGRLASG